MSTNLIAVPDAKEAGAVVWWSLSGDINYTKFSDAWALAALPPELFRDPTRERLALRRAVMTMHKPTQRVLVRPLDRGRWVIVQEFCTDGQLAHYADLEVSAGDNGQPNVKHSASFAGEDRGLAYDIQTRLRERYDHFLGSLTATDVGMFLAHLAIKLSGLALRDKGGMYFIPKHRMADWNAAITVLRAVSAHRVYQLPSLRTDEAVRAILDALTGEADSLVSEVEEAITNGAGPRSLATREARLREMTAKVRAYEELLDWGMGSLQARLGGLEAQVASAILMSSVETEEAA